MFPDHTVCTDARNIIGGPGPSATIFYFSPQLNLQKSNGLFSIKTIIFKGSRRGSNFSQGGGGVQLHISFKNPNIL